MMISGLTMQSAVRFDWLFLRMISMISMKPNTLLM